MIRRENQIGFNQRVRLEWLERTAGLVMAGNGRSAANEALQEMLKEKVSVGRQDEGHPVESHPVERGNREKVITILLKVWLSVPAEREPLRAEGLELLKSLPSKDHIAVHWGMAMAAYPFWAEVAGSVGRLLKLQGSAAAAHVQRRMREKYGERETVSRAARRVLRSYIDWGVLGETGKKGIYRQGLSLSVDNPKLAAWMIEAVLHTRENGCAPFKELVESSILFPFRFKPAAAEGMRTASPRLERLRHGLDEELIMLRR